MLQRKPTDPDTIYGNIQRQNIDTVWLDENGWWWYDEAGYETGPYNTRDEAFDSLENYCYGVLGVPKQCS